MLQILAQTDPSAIYRVRRRLPKAARLHYCSAMFCPNCAAQNESSQHYCRTCGLKLDALEAELKMQNPSDDLAILLKKKRRMDLLGTGALSIAGIIGFSLLLTVAVYYKLMLLGPELLFGSAIGALILFLLAAIFFLAYSKFVLKIDRVVSSSSQQPELTVPTGKLLQDPAPFEPASVTEHSTELLRRK
jgi:hypothetical protein